jgi:hypothetical protein
MFHSNVDSKITISGKKIIKVMSITFFQKKENKNPFYMEFFKYN